MTDHLTGECVVCPDGRLVLRRTAAGLCRWFADRFLRMAIEAGADEYRFGPAIARATLARAGYFAAFPNGATSIAREGDGPDYCLSPAVCYHAYEHFAGRTFDRPVILTAESSCFRDADRRAGGFGRLWEFTMREVVTVGASTWVAAGRDEWMARIGDFAASLGLEGSIEPATDPFFGNGGKGKQLLQQLKGLKYELRLGTGQGPQAVASFNLHETFFSGPFALSLEGGAEAHSGCVAFGLERWVLAFLDQQGPAAAEALMRRHGTR